MVHCRSRAHSAVNRRAVFRSCRAVNSEQQIGAALKACIGGLGEWARYGRAMSSSAQTPSKMPTASDVARLAGVAQSTVSYVMSGKRAISEATRLRVQAAIDELTYHPNAGAQALAGRRRGVIGLVLHFDESTDMAGTLPFMRTITAHARARDYDVVLVSSDDGAAEMERLAKRAVVDAFIVMDIRADDDRLATAADLGVPVVLIGAPNDTQGIDSFDYDVTATAELAVDELIRDGAERILLIGEAPEVLAENFGFVAQFEAATERLAAERGVAFELFRPASNDLGGFTLTRQAMTQKDGRTGIIARTPRTAGWVIYRAMESGLRFERDLGLVAVCTDAAAEGFGIAVTNVSPEPENVSAAAMDRLLKILSGEPGERAESTVLIAPRLTRRATTR